MIRWLRVVLPYGIAPVIFAIVYLLTEGVVVWLEWHFGQKMPGLRVRPGGVLLNGACVAYGVCRVTYFHPFYNHAYRAWLENTPWTSRKSLPLGPIHLVLQDGVIFLLLGALALEAEVSPLGLLALLLGSYLTALGVSFAAGRTRGFAYVIFFGLGLMVYLAKVPWASAAAGIAIYLVSLIGLRRSLAQFPWEFHRQDGFEKTHWRLTPESTAALKVLDKKTLVSRLGWPFEALREGAIPGPRIQTHTAVLTGLLAGWWLYAGGSLLSNPNDRWNILAGTEWNLAFALAGIRLSNYCIGYSQTLSLWGRIRTFHWIIPGYDQVFLAPIATMILGIALPRTLISFSVEPDIAFPLALSFSWMAAMIIGPGLQEWRLVGKNRMVAALKFKGPENIQIAS